MNIEKIDHFVYVVPSLEEGVAKIEKLLGVMPSPGGSHPDKGTHNALVGLGSRTYFEIIAPDPSQKHTGDRWMGVDRPENYFRITRWAFQLDTLEEKLSELSEYFEKPVSLFNGRRISPEGGILEWKMTEPLSRHEIEIVPFLIAWNGNDHPCQSIKHPCRLTRLRLFHPHPQKINHVLALLEVPFQVQYGKIPRISVQIDSPNGTVLIS